MNSLAVLFWTDIPPIAI